MYGWIETGGYFDNTVETGDVVFRTSLSNQCIAIGNANGADTVACQYVKNNNLGIQCLPRNGHVLSVKGNSIFSEGVLGVEDIVNQTHIDCDGIELRFINSIGKESVHINTNDSRVGCDSLVTKTILTHKKILENVLIVQTGTTTVRNTFTDTDILGHEITIDALYNEDIIDDSVIIINKRTYYVWSANIISPTQMIITISSYSSYAPPNELTCASGDYVKIEILEDWVPASGISRIETLSYRMLVDTFNYSASASGANTQLRIKMYFRNRKEVLRETLDPGTYYVISNNNVITNITPSTILKLASFQTYVTSNDGQVGYDMQFGSIDGMSDLTAINNIITSSATGVQKTFYLLPMTFIAPPRIVDTDSIVGYTIDAITNRLCYQLVNSTIASFTSEYQANNQYFSCAIDNIALGNRAIKSVLGYYKPFAPDTVVLDTVGGVDDTVFTVSRQTITCEFRGIPIRITGYTRIADIIADFEIESEFNDLLCDFNVFVNHYLHWIDSNAPQGVVYFLNKFEYTSYSKAKITLTAQSLTTFDNPIFNEINRIVYVVPIKYTTHIRIGEKLINTYLPGTVSIGTHLVRETLTVKGNASFVGDMRLYNGKDTMVRQNRFVMAYNEAHELNMNGRLRIGQSNMSVVGPIEVNNTITATDYLQYSDARLKRHIKNTDTEDDLQRISRVDVRTFRFNKCPRESKGVIAQEVRDVFPEAVTSVRDVLPCLEQLAYVDRNGFIRLNMTSDEENIVKEGSVLRFVLDDCRYLDLKVNRIDVVNCPKGIDNIYTKTINAYLDKFECICDKRFIKVIGLVDDVLLVNYEILYMSTINAVKHLNSELFELKNLLLKEMHNGEHA